MIRFPISPQGCEGVARQHIQRKLLGFHEFGHSLGSSTCVCVGSRKCSDVTLVKDSTSNPGLELFRRNIGKGLALKVAIDRMLKKCTSVYAW